MALRTLIGVLAEAAAHYLATRAAWLLTYPDSQVSFFYLPHAVLVSILLVSAHGGRLWAEKRAERGAAFYVALPLAAGS